jgi:hypothetical protein
MTTQDWFFLWGTFFFISWFVFLLAMVVSIIIVVKQLKEMRVEMEARIDKMQILMEEKLNQPGTAALMSILPLIPSVVKTGQKLFRRKG